jgi:hypothetical protein
MVQIASLGGEERTIRTIVDTPTGKVTVYEPTNEDVEKIMELDDFISALNQDPDEEGNDVDQDEYEATLEISGVTVMRELIPLLTDIEVPEELSDEELNKIIEHPTMALTMVKHVLTGIVTDVYKIMILSVQNELKSADLTFTSEELSNRIMDLYSGLGVNSDEGTQALKQIEKEKSALQDAVPKSELETKSQNDQSESNISLVKPKSESEEVNEEIQKLNETFKDDDDEEPQE